MSQRAFCSFLYIQTGIHFLHFHQPVKHPQIAQYRGAVPAFGYGEHMEKQRRTPPLASNVSSVTIKFITVQTHPIRTLSDWESM